MADDTAPESTAGDASEIAAAAAGQPGAEAPAPGAEQGAETTGDAQVLEPEKPAAGTGAAAETDGVGGGAAAETAGPNDAGAPETAGDDAGDGEKTAGAGELVPGESFFTPRVGFPVQFFAPDLPGVPDGTPCAAIITRVHQAHTSDIAFVDLWVIPPRAEPFRAFDVPHADDATGRFWDIPGRQQHLADR